MTWNRRSSIELGKAIVAAVEGIETTSVLLTRDRLGSDDDNKKSFPAGAVISRIGTAYHIYPASKVTAAFSTGAATGTVELPRVFKAGDVLTVPDGHHVITITGTWTTGGNVNVTLPNGFVKAIATGAGGSNPMTTTQVAAKVALELNNDPVASDLLFTTNIANVVYAFNKREMNSASFAVASTSNASDLALVTRPPGTVVGTILSYTNAGVITLTGNAAIAVPIGANVAVAVNEIVGIYPQPIDLTYQPTQSIAPIITGRIYQTALPYFSDRIRRSLPKIKFAEKF